MTPFVISAQDSAFVRTYGGVNMDIARDVKETPDKGFVVGGTTSSFGQGNTSMYLVKTDSMGRHLWSKNYGGLNSEWAYTVEATMDNGFLLAGFSNSFSSNYDPYVVKTDANGDLMWQKVYGTDDWDFIYGSCMLPDSGFVLCGETYGNAIGGGDGYVIRIDKAGNQIWAINVGTVNDDKLNKIILLNNTLYAVGSSFVSGHQYGLLAKIDLNGNVAPLITYNFNTNSDQELMCITANSVSQLIFGGYVNPDGVNDINDWMIQSDTLGNVVFNYSVPAGTNGTKRFDDIVTVEFDEIVVCGTTNGGNGGLGLFMVRFNSNGVYLAADVFGGFGNEYGYGLALTSNKHLAFVGSSDSYGCGDQDMYYIMNRNQHFVSNSKLNNKYFCDTLDLAVVDLKELDSKERLIKCYPNPFSDKLTIDLQDDENDAKQYNFELKDISGRLVYKTNLQKGINELSITDVQQGMYFFNVYSQNKLESSGKLIKY